MGVKIISRETTKVNLRQAPTASIVSAGYDEESKVMVIHFMDHYEEFHEVPRLVYESFITTLQRGWQIAARMKDNYKHRIYLK